MSDDTRHTGWPALPYESWSPTCDTLHAHTQVLGKLAVALAPAEPQLLHAALRVTARGWETRLLRAPDGSGAFTVALDLRSHEAAVEHSDGRARRVPLTPHRSVGAVTRDVVAAVREVAGEVTLHMTPQEVAWTAPLDADEEHATYDTASVETYHAAAVRAALALAELRAPYRGRATPVNAWWGSFDLSVLLFSGRPADPPADDFITRNSATAQEIQVGWWPGDARHPYAAFYAYAFPAPDAFAGATVAPAAAHWDAALGEYILEWDDVIAAPDPHAAVLDFGHSVIAHACAVCGWDPAMAASAHGEPPPVR